MAKATPEARVDPLAHVEMILDAEAPAPRQAQTVPTVMAQSKKLSEMLDTITDASQIEDTLRAVDEEMVKIATVGTEAERKASDPTPVKLPPPRNYDAPAKAAPKAPKEAGVPDYEPRSASRSRNRKAGPAPTGQPIALPTGSPGGGTTALNGEHVASLLKMTHAVGATVLGPSFSISDESARAIGDAALPVLEDFGVAVASRAVHLLMLVSTVAMIEGPIILTTMTEMRTKAAMRQAGFGGMAMGEIPQTDEDMAAAVARATGVVVGS